MISQLLQTQVQRAIKSQQFLHKMTNTCFQPSIKISKRYLIRKKARMLNQEKANIQQSFNQEKTHGGNQFITQHHKRLRFFENIQKRFQKMDSFNIPNHLLVHHSIKMIHFFHAQRPSYSQGTHDLLICEVFRDLDILDDIIDD